MNGRAAPHGVPLGGVQVPIAEVTIYPLAGVLVREGGLDLGDATHHLSIVLPQHNWEIRIPYNAAGLRKLGREAQHAGGVAMPARDESEGE